MFDPIKVRTPREYSYNSWLVLLTNLPLLSGGDNETDGVTFSSNLAVLFDKDVEEPDVDDDSLKVTIIYR